MSRPPNPPPAPDGGHPRSLRAFAPHGRWTPPRPHEVWRNEGLEASLHRLVRGPLDESQLQERCAILEVPARCDIGISDCRRNPETEGKRCQEILYVIQYTAIGGCLVADVNTSCQTRTNLLIVEVESEADQRSTTWATHLRTCRSVRKPKYVIGWSEQGEGWDPWIDDQGGTGWAWKCMDKA